MEAHLNICTQNGVFFGKVGLKWFVQCAALVSYILCWFILIYSLPIRVNVQSYYNRIGVCALCIDMCWWFIRKIFCVSRFWTSKRGSWKLCEVQTVQQDLQTKMIKHVSVSDVLIHLGFRWFQPGKACATWKFANGIYKFPTVPRFTTSGPRSPCVFASFACSVFGNCLVHPWPGKPGKNPWKTISQQKQFRVSGKYTRVN